MLIMREIPKASRKKMVKFLKGYSRHSLQTDSADSLLSRAGKTHKEHLYPFEKSPGMLS